MYTYSVNVNIRRSFLSFRQLKFYHTSVKIDVFAGLVLAWRKQFRMFERRRHSAHACASLAATLLLRAKNAGYVRDQSVSTVLSIVHPDQCYGGGVLYYSIPGAIPCYRALYFGILGQNIDDRRGS